MDAVRNEGDEAWREHVERVTSCYTYYERLSNVVGRSDYTDGMYLGDRSTSYETAQRRQTEYLLDEAKVGPGTRLLDLGCGRGRLLEAAVARGAKAIGITISPEQVAYCKARGLDVRLLDYRALPSEGWDRSFDAVIANGSIEHFVATREGLSGKAGARYRALFERVHALIDPSSTSRRFVTTVIHHRIRYGTKVALPVRSKLLFSALNRIYGGWYPLDGQLEHCAKGRFEATRAVDGTEDYLWTSQDFRRWWTSFVPRGAEEAKALFSFLRMLAGTGVELPLFLLNPMLWTAQFRGDPPPVVLRRHTWEYAPS